MLDFNEFLEIVIDRQGDSRDMHDEILKGFSLFDQGKMNPVTRKPVFKVSDQVQHTQGCTATEDALRLEILDLGSTGILL